MNSQEKINRGLSKARRSQKPWLPGPGEFCSWCQTSLEDYGLLSADAAFDQARMQVGKPAQWRQWAHEIVYLSAVETNFFDLKTLKDSDPNFRRVKERFSEIYQAYVARALSGETFSIPASHRIEAQAFNPSDPRHQKAGERALGNMLALFDE